MLRVRVAGQWLSTIGAHGPVTVEYGPHGSEAASWEMAETVRHQALRGGATVEIYDGGFRVWVGTLVEPGSDGTFHAVGLWREAQHVYALNQFGDISSNPQDTLAWANARGDLTWARDDTAFASTNWGSPTEPTTVEALLDGVTAELGTRWFIDPTTKKPAHAAAPTVPKWVVPNAVAGRGLTPAEDEYFSHLMGRYRDTGNVYRSTTVGSTDAATAFGRRRLELVDLSALGLTTSAKVTAVLQGMLLKAGARMGWAEGLDLGYGQVTTPGGVPATLSQIASLQAIRLAGVVDVSRPYLIRTNTDLVLETVKYTDGEKRITMTPFGYAPRNMGDVLTVAVDE